MQHKIIFLLSILFLLNSSAFGQDTLRHKPTHSLYAEVGGATFIGYSVNYEIILRDYLSREYAFRIGGAIIPFRNTFNSNYELSSIIFQMPIEIIVLTGHINHGSMEIGIGSTPAFGDRYFDGNRGTKYGIHIVHYNFDNVPFFQLGYRYQSDIKYFIFRIDFTYLFLSEYYDDASRYNNIIGQFWGGVSYGYCFR